MRELKWLYVVVMVCGLLYMFGFLLSLISYPGALANTLSGDCFFRDEACQSWHKATEPFVRYSSILLIILMVSGLVYRYGRFFMDLLITIRDLLVSGFKSLSAIAASRLAAGKRDRQYTSLLRAKELLDAGVFSNEEYEIEVAKIKGA
jgi:hypothetical protein